jgi:hypothetical protein
MRYYLNRLRTGIPKIQILKELRDAPEFKVSSTKMAEPNKHIHHHHSNIFTLPNRLLTAPENNFMRVLTIAKRLLINVSNISPKKKKSANILLELNTEIRRYNQKHWPILGHLFAAQDNSLEKKLNTIENQIFLAHAEIELRFNQLEITLKHSQLTPIHEHPIQTDVTATAFSNTPTELEQLTPRARDIYLQLKTAAAIHTKDA